MTTTEVLTAAVIILLLLLPAWAYADEKSYQLPWCYRHAGVVEHVLPDRTRVDCLTATHAVEFDFGKKAFEAVGQALYYASQTGLRAGIVLIISDDADRRGKIRLIAILEEYKLPIDVWYLSNDAP